MWSVTANSMLHRRQVTLMYVACSEAAMQTHIADWTGVVLNIELLIMEKSYHILCVCFQDGFLLVSCKDSF